MIIQTFGVDNYKGYPIYYRNFNNQFEYFVIIDSQLYTANIGVKPHWITYALYLLGIEKLRYSRQQLGNILKQLKLMAITTIDFIQKNKGEATAR